MLLNIADYRKAVDSAVVGTNYAEQIIDEKNRCAIKNYLIKNLHELGYTVLVLDSNILGNNSNIMKLERLSKEVEGLKMKLNKAIPFPAILLMCISLAISVIFATFMGIFYVTGIELITLPTACMVTLSALVLFATSLYAISDWRKWLNEESTPE